MAGKGGGAWKVAYADFVTAMMAFFMVMWITAQGKPAVKESIAEYFRDPYGSKRSSRMPAGKGEVGSKNVGPLQSGKGPGRGLSKGSFMAPPSPNAKTSASTKPSLVVVHGGIDSRTGTMILFPEFSADLDEDSKNRLSEIVPMLLGKPNKIEIRGHTSKRPLPKDCAFQDPWQLSYARCVATMKYLEEQGVEPERVRISQAGPFEPYSIRVEPEWQSHNSRVEVFTLGEYVADFQGTKEEQREQSGEADNSKDTDHDAHAAAHSDAHANAHNDHAHGHGSAH